MDDVNVRMKQLCECPSVAALQRDELTFNMTQYSQTNKKMIYCSTRYSTNSIDLILPGFCSFHTGCSEFTRDVRSSHGMHPPSILITHDVQFTMNAFYFYSQLSTHFLSRRKRVYSIAILSHRHQRPGGTVVHLLNKCNKPILLSSSRALDAVIG